ncbi:MAG TPA: hypothetical protein VKG25_20145 [Bryobacteraceae bacterium]|nr:hypothetical protein [Bryobacteraceae bacterium]
MNENRRLILEMLATGKITAEEAERLISSFEKEYSSTNGTDARPKAKPKYLRVLVEAEDEKDHGPVKVNVRIPMQLLRAGVRLTSLIPPQARNHVNEALRKQGIEFDLNQLKPENLEEVIDQLNDLTVDVEHSDAKVRVFCE